EVGHRLRWTDHPEGHVAIEVQGQAAGHRVAGRRDVPGVDQVMPMRRASIGVRSLDAHGGWYVDLVRLGRRGVVVEQRRAAGESLHPEQLLRVERAVL